MTKHTPGDWGYISKGPRTITLKRRHWRVGSDSTNKGVALVFGDTEADAILIAAAPDMLEELKDCLRILR